MKLKTAILTIAAAVLSVMPVSNSVAAGSIFWGANSAESLVAVYYFAHGYADVASAVSVARTLCNAEQRICNNLLGDDDGIKHGEAWVEYSAGEYFYSTTGSSIAEARVSAAQFCGEDNDDPCRESLALQDSGDSNPQLQRITITVSRSGGSNGGSGSGGSGGSAGAIIGGAVAVGGLIWLYNANTPDLPDAETSFITVAEYADGDLSVGGRLGWQKGRMSAFWKVGDSLHGSGLQYDGDFWTAAFSESVQGETADYDVSLSADWTGGIWKVSPEFAVDSRYENGEFATTNSFRINGELRYDDWRFSASGSKTQMHLSAVLEF